MNIAYFPLTHPIRKEADQVISALNARSARLKQSIQSQPLIKKISGIVLKTLSMEAFVFSAATLPIGLVTFTFTPLIIASMCLTTAIICLAICILLDPRRPGELIVNDQWKALFKALQHGNGKEIVQICQELARQNEQRSTSFVRCLGSLKPIEVAPFLHKICLAGYLLYAIENLQRDEMEQAKTCAQQALSHFDQSGFSKEVESCAKEIANHPLHFQLELQLHIGKLNLKHLDYLLVMKRKIRQKKMMRF